MCASNCAASILFFRSHFGSRSKPSKFTWLWIQQQALVDAVVWYYSRPQGSCSLSSWEHADGDCVVSWLPVGRYSSLLDREFEICISIYIYIYIGGWGVRRAYRLPPDREIDFDSCSCRACERARRSCEGVRRVPPYRWAFGLQLSVLLLLLLRFGLRVYNSGPILGLKDALCGARARLFAR